MTQINIAGTLHNTEEIQGDALNSHVVVHADEILDTTKEKKQSEVNADVDTALADRYTKSETYSKSQVDNLITTPEVQYVTVTATAQTTSVTDVLPATGAADTIYRVGSWDGSVFDAGKYSEYAWNGSAYQLLAVRSGSFDGVFDISANNLTEGQPTQYADLAAALGTNGANVPVGVRAGGMQVRFINSTTGKYKQCRLMAASWSTTVTDWQDVDDTPTAGSKNLVTSGGVAELIYGLIGEFSIDLVTGQAIALSTYNKGLELNSGDKYKISITGARTGGSTFNIALFDSSDTQINFKGSIAASNLDSQTASQWLNVSSLMTEVYILPSSDVAAMKFYATKSNIKDTVTVEFKVRDYPVQNGILERIDALEANEGVPNDNSVNTSKIVDGSVTTAKIADANVTAAKLSNNSVTNAKIASKSISIEKLDDTLSGAFVEVHSVNLLNTSDPDVLLGQYINTATTTATNQEYNVTGYIPVEAGKTYYLGSTNKGVSFATMVFYDASKNAMTDTFVPPSSPASNCTAPAGAAYARFSWRVDRWSEPWNQITEGSRKDYIAYSPAYIAPNITDGSVTEAKLSDGAVTEDKIADGAITEEKLSSTIQPNPRLFSSLRNASDSIASNSALYTDTIRMKKNVVIAAHIDGAITDVSVGVGYSSTETSKRTYDANWVRITPSSVELYITQGATSPSQTYTHGLTLTDKTDVFITTNAEPSNSSIAKLSIITDLGERYDVTLATWYGVGCAFLENKNSSSIGGTISIMPKDITRRIWMFGDSYFEYNNTARWVYYLLTDGFKQTLINYMGGETAEQALVDFQSLLSTGYRPSFAVWCLGMNGNGDTYNSTTGQWDFNSTQKGWLDSFIALCVSNKITPILATIPSVSGNGSPRIHKGQVNYIKSLDYRYIDFDDAVGSTDEGEWNEGLLSSDEVHPTAAGAKVLYGRAIADFPEMTISN